MIYYGLERDLFRVCFLPIFFWDRQSIIYSKDFEGSHVGKQRLSDEEGLYKQKSNYRPWLQVVRSPFDQPLPKPLSDYPTSILRDAAHAEEQRPQFVHSCSPSKVALLTINSHLRVLYRDDMTLTPLSSNST